MASMTLSPAATARNRAASVQLSTRLKECWEHDLNWELLPRQLNEGCHQVGQALSMPATAVLAGILLIVSFAMSHAVVEVENTDWLEPILLWISVCMPTGSGKSSLCKWLRQIVEDAHAMSTNDESPSWFLDDQSFEKMGALMHANHSKLLSLYDELPMFLMQINVFRRKGLSDSHELAVFLQLYGANPWVRKTVSGEANFEMKYTGLTIGGFTQPSVARSLIEQQTNVEKGFTQRLLWVVPKPMQVPFDMLQKVNKEFSTSIIGLMAALWSDNSSVRKWVISKPCEVFRKKYDDVQDLLQKLSCMDDFLSGMLSKSRGQILRVAATLHVLHYINQPLVIPDTISESAIKAAENFVDMCIQHAAYIAGRGNVEEAVSTITMESSDVDTHSGGQVQRNAAFSLLLPGKTLHLNALLEMRKFRDKGNKEGTIRAFRLLEETGLGKVIEIKPQRGTSIMYQFQKVDIPEEVIDKKDLMEKLLPFSISISQYESAINMDDITITSVRSRKRPSTGNETPVRRSPRKTA